MSDQERLAEILEDYHQRRAAGQTPTAEDYRERLGDDYSVFCRILEAEDAVEQVLDAEERPAEGPTLPRPFGAYTLLRELGRGAMGVVYEALHRDLGRKVALKILRSGFDTAPEALERFRREARACAQVRHDNIVEVYEVGEAEDRPFYAMTLIEGRSLSELARAGELPSPRELATAIADIADALHHLHEKDIVHRDVKPSNIMVEASGRLVLADFGLARTLESDALTATGESLGTPLYMSPEQLLGKRDEINGRTDVYGLGATLYELWGGRKVFAVKDVRELMRAILTQRPKPLREIAPRLPREAGAIVAKALEKENRDRYETAAAMRDDLRALAAGGKVRGRPMSGAKRALRYAQCNRVPLAAAAAVLVAIVLIVALQPPAPAQLSLACVPDAKIWIDGEGPLPSPLVGHELEPGAHEVLLMRDGWRERRRTLQLDSGPASFEMILTPLNAGDPAALDLITAKLELQMQDWDGVVLQRGAGDGDVEILYPRGEVRMKDLAQYRFDLSDTFDGKGEIVFRADDRVLWRRAVNEDWPVKTLEVDALPDEVRRALATGVQVTWGFYPKEGDPVTATFEVVEDEVTARLDTLRESLEDADPLLLKQIEAQLCLDASLHLAAYQAALEAAKGLEKAPKAYAIMKSALERMDLENSILWQDLARLAGE